MKYSYRLSHQYHSRDHLWAPIDRAREPNQFTRGTFQIRNPYAKGSHVERTSIGLRIKPGQTRLVLQPTLAGTNRLQTRTRSRPLVERSLTPKERESTKRDTRERW